MADAVNDFQWWGIWLATFLVLLLLTIGTLVIGSYAVSDSSVDNASQAKYGWWMIGVGIAAALATIVIGVFGIIKTARRLIPAARRGFAAGQSEAERALLEEKVAKIEADQARALQKSQARATRTGATQHLQLQQQPAVVSPRAQDILAGGGAGSSSASGSEANPQYQSLAIRSAAEAAAYEAAARQAAEARQFGRVPTTR